MIPGTVPSGYAGAGNPDDNLDHTAHRWTQHDLPQHNFIPGKRSQPPDTFVHPVTGFQVAPAVPSSLLVHSIFVAVLIVSLQGASQFAAGQRHRADPAR